MGPDRRFGSFGLCFGPNGRFSTHFGPNLMFLDLTELWPMWPICPDGTRRALTDDSMDPYRCTTKIRTHTDPRRAPTSKRSVELSRAARGSASSAARYIQLANL